MIVGGRYVSEGGVESSRTAVQQSQSSSSSSSFLSHLGGEGVQAGVDQESGFKAKRRLAAGLC
jgi:hypothetical protein